jgi:hypothetical protein
VERNALADVRAAQEILAWMSNLLMIPASLDDATIAYVGMIIAVSAAIAS